MKKVNSRNILGFGVFAETVVLVAALSGSGGLPKEVSPQEIALQTTIQGALRKVGANVLYLATQTQAAIPCTTEIISPRTIAAVCSQQADRKTDRPDALIEAYMHTQNGVANPDSTFYVNIYNEQFSAGVTSGGEELIAPEGNGYSVEPTNGWSANAFVDLRQPRLRKESWELNTAYSQNWAPYLKHELLPNPAATAKAIAEQTAAFYDAAFNAFQGPTPTESGERLV